MKQTTKNVSGVFNARYGTYGGKKYLFTHRNPSNGYLWSDDIPDANGLTGKWVSSEKVQLD